jgi:hypothetical protein
MAPGKKESGWSGVLTIAVILAVAYVLWRLFGEKLMTSKSVDDDANAAILRVPRKPTEETLPNGTTTSLASAMAASIDATFPKIESSAVQVIHGDTEARTYAADAVERMKLAGASVTLMSPDTAKIAKFVDGKGIVRCDVEFLVYDVTETKPGYPSNQVAKLKAVYLSEPSSKPALYSLNFATPREENGAMDGFDASAENFARFESPLEVLKQMNFSPDAPMQT